MSQKHSMFSLLLGFLPMLLTLAVFSKLTAEPKSFQWSLIFQYTTVCLTRPVLMGT